VRGDTFEALRFVTLPIHSILNFHCTLQDDDYDLVPLVVIPMNIIGDYEGFPMVLEEKIVSHFLVPLEGALQSVGAHTEKGWLVEVRVTSSHNFIRWFMGLNQPMPSFKRSLHNFFSTVALGPNAPELEYWKRFL
jgi:hypothetical protein